MICEHILLFIRFRLFQFAVSYNTQSQFIFIRLISLVSQHLIFSSNLILLSLQPLQLIYLFFLFISSLFICLFVVSVTVF